VTFLLSSFHHKLALSSRVSLSISEINMSFTATYRTVLFPFVHKYKEARNEQGRKGVVKNAVDAVKESKALLEDAEDLPKDLPTVRIPPFVRHSDVNRRCCRPFDGS